MTRGEAETVAVTTGWLSHQPEAFRARILEAAEMRVVRAGATIYSLGDPPNGIYGIVEGFVDVLIAPGPFPPYLAHIGRPGWWVGEAALVGQSSRRAGLIARTGLWMLYVSQEKLDQIAHKDPLTWRRVCEITVSHLDNALSLSACLSASDLRLRLIGTLCRLSGYPDAPDGSVELPITQAELGEMANLSRNSVARLLADLARENLVERRYKRIVVDATRLQALLHEDGPRPR